MTSINYEVTCELCECRWPMDDPAVRYDPGTGIWHCTHEPSCFLRCADTKAQFDELMRQWARRLELSEIPATEEI